MKVIPEIGNIYKYLQKDVYVKVIDAFGDNFISCTLIETPGHKFPRDGRSYFYVFHVDSLKKENILKLISDVEDLALLKLLGYNL